MSLVYRLAPLEKEVLGRIIRGDDPWNGWKGASGVSGRYSAAVNRLRDKGFITSTFNQETQDTDYSATPLGVQEYRESQ